MMSNEIHRKLECSPADAHPQLSRGRRKVRFVSYETIEAEMNPFSKIPEGTVLFVDKPGSDSLALSYGFADLVPKIFSMICKLDSPDIPGLLQKFMNIFDFEHIALFIGGPLRSYTKQIRSIVDFGEFDIVSIIGMFPGDDLASLPRSVSPKIYTHIPPIVCKISPRFGLAPAIPRALPTVLLNPDGLNPEIVANIVSDILRTNLKAFSYGEFSEQVMACIDNERTGEPTAAVLFVDRASCCTPLFMHNSSLLDKAASIDWITAVRDKGLVAAELAGSLLQELGKALDMNVSSVEQARKEWNKLSASQKSDIIKNYPAIECVLSNKDSDLAQIEKSLLEGADLNDMIEFVSLDYEKYIRIVAFGNCIEPLEIDDYITRGLEDCTSGTNKIVSKARQLAILENCSSGVELEMGKTISADRIHYLPQLIESIVNPQKPVGGDIKGGGSGLLGMISMFGAKRYDLKQFKKLFVVVFGGISFFEMRKINEICDRFKSGIEIQVISDTICSSFDLLKA